MELKEQTAVVALRSGRARGRVKDGVLAFRGLPYGERINPASRTSDVKRAEPWQGEFDATVQGAVFPQSRSRLATVMGDGIDANPQSEDAFVLNVWAPVAGESLPVFVFIHGGGFVSGGGSAAWYDGEQLARHGNMVVVTVNYRLGALGHYAEGGDPTAANRPVRDLLRALEWVQENIAQFGGDPAEVTVGGQSAGAWYSWLLGMTPAAKGMLRRNVLLSLPIVPPMAPNDVLMVSKQFSEIIGGRAFDSLSTAEILAAQGALMRSRMAFGEVAVAFHPVAEEGLVPDWLFDIPRAAREAHVTETLLGVTAEESTAFMFMDPAIVNVDEAAARGWFTKHYGSEADRAYSEFALRRREPTPYSQLIDGSSHKLFGAAVGAIAQEFNAVGKAAYPYRFNVQTGVPNLMSPHCLELPFLFGNRDDWADAPMLLRVSDVVFERVGDALRAAVCNFVRSGAPSDVSGTPWQRYSSRSSGFTEFVDDGVSAQHWAPSRLPQ